MIIPSWIFWAIGILTFIVVYILLKRKVNPENVWRWALVAGIFSALLFSMLLMAPAKHIIVVNEKDGAPGTYTHKTFDVYGKPNLKISEDETIRLTNAELERGKTYLFNDTDTSMLLYPMVYNFGKGKEIEKPHWVLVDSLCYDQIPHAPDFWFADAPDTISERHNVLEVLWNKIFGSAVIKWALVPFDPYEDETENDDVEATNDEEAETENTDVE